MNTIALVRTLILPPMSLFLIYGVGFLIQGRLPRLGHVLRITAIFLLILLSTQAGAWLFMRPLESLEKPLLSTKHTDAQAIVVLAAGRLRNNPEYSGLDIPDAIALARLRYTAKLQHETGLPVLVSGGSATSETGIEPLSYGMSRALQNEFNTPVKWIEDKSFNTAENAVYSAQLLKRAGIQHILLVTDAMHMYRAKMMFEQQGLIVIAAPTQFFSLAKITRMDFFPNVESLRRANYAIYEWLGIAWYRLRYEI
jgi:uncharacterized SAM-binding protein YcdF (DUF218 family)